MISAHLLEVGVQVAEFEVELVVVLAPEVLRGCACIREQGGVGGHREHHRCRVGEGDPEEGQDMARRVPRERRTRVSRVGFGRVKLLLNIDHKLLPFRSVAADVEALIVSADEAAHNVIPPALIIGTDHERQLLLHFSTQQ